MTKKQYALCEEAAKEMKNLPEYETIAKASQLLNDGGYWGPEAEDRIKPEDVNVDALKVQMQMFLKRYGHDQADVDLSDFKELVDKVMSERGGEGKGEGRRPRKAVSSQPMETLVTKDDF